MTHPIDHDNLEELLPLAPMQEAMLFAGLKDPRAYIQQLQFHVVGALDPERLIRAFELLVSRHAILRASFLWEGVDAPLHVIHRHVQVPVRIAPAEEALAKVLEAERRAFDFAVAPLLRLAVKETDRDRWTVVFTHAHILLDGWSTAILVSELSEAYRGNAMPEPAGHLRDHLAWIQQHESDVPNVARTIKGWMGDWGAPTSIPYDRLRAPVSERQGDLRDGLHGSVRRVWGNELLEAFKRAAKKHRVTLAALVAAAWGVVLHKASREERVVFGLTCAGRSPDVPGAETIVGNLIQTLPLVVEMPLPVSELVSQVQERVSSLQEHAFVPLGAIRSAVGLDARVPLFDSIVVVENFPRTATLADGITVASIDTLERPDVPLALIVAPGDGTVELRLLFDRERFVDGDLEVLLGAFECALKGLFEEENFDALKLTSEKELADGCAPDAEAHVDARTPTPARTPSDARTLPHASVSNESLTAWFARVAATEGARVAVRDTHHQWTYTEIDTLSTRIAHGLRSKGVRAGDRVGLALGRSGALVPAVLGILKAGAAYVPLDVRLPTTRLHALVRETKMVHAICDAPLDLGEVEKHAIETLSQDTPSDPLPPPSPGDLAYVLFTSGSTGQPKGVEITHANVARLLRVTEQEFAFGPNDVWTLFHSMSFDFSVWELFGALLTGGTLIVVSHETTRDPYAFRELLLRERVTVLNQTPSAFYALDAADAADTVANTDLSLRVVVFGGEALDPSRLGPWFTRHNRSPRFVNMYGITETTVHVTYREITPADCVAARNFGSPIGLPLADLEIALVDPEGHPVPDGMVGEMWIGGAGVAVGYHADPTRTAERFLVRGGKRFYRSGDLARRANGEYWFIGRGDAQVKIRGFRIELGEIESTLRSKSGVLDAAVLREGEELAAFVVTSGPTPAEAAFVETIVRPWLSAELPEHCVPRYIREIDKIPLTVNGKRDERSLRALLAKESAPIANVAPTSNDSDLLEQFTRDTWSSVLGESVGLDDDVFLRGAHSLLLVQVLSRLRDGTGAAIPLSVLFEAPTPRRLAEALRALTSVSIPSPKSAALGGPDSTLMHEGLSPSEARIFFLESLSGGSDRTLFTVPAAVVLRGPLDVDRLQRSLDALVLRHDALRTSFEANGGASVRRVAEAGSLRLHLHPVRDQEEAKERAKRDASMPIPLHEAPLAHVHLYSWGRESHLLLFAVHHIVADGWSLGVLLRDAFHVYGGGQLSPGTLTLAEAAARAKGPHTQAIAHFAKSLEGMPACIDLPLDHRRPLMPSYRGQEWTVDLSSDRMKAVRAKAAAMRATPFMLLLSALKLVLLRWSKDGEVCVGVSVAGRTSQALESMVGCFVNVLPLRVRTDEQASLQDFVEEVRRVSLQGLMHAAAPFESLVEAISPPRSLAHSPLFQVNFVYQNFPVHPALPAELRLEPVAMESDIVRFDLVLTIDERGEEGARATFLYATDLFDAPTIARFADHYRSALDALLGDLEIPLGSVPLRSVPVSSVPLRSGPLESVPARNVSLGEKPAAHLARPGASPPLLWQRVFAHALERPKAIAVRHEESFVDYEELRRQVLVFATELHAMGIGHGKVVAIAMESTVSRIIVILAVHRVGAAFVPLERSEPLPRRVDILEQAHPRLIVTDEIGEDELPATDVPILRADRIASAAAPREDALPSPNDPRALAYILFTSGSTGRPKGVRIRQDGLANLVDAQIRAFGIGTSDRVLQFASFAFDASISEIGMALGAGAVLDLGDARGWKTEGIVAYLSRRAITAVTLPPSLLRQEEPSDRLPDLRVVISAGEAAFDGMAERWGRSRGFFNAYGPTEITVCATIHEWKDASVSSLPGRIPIGTAIDGAQVLVIDADQNPVEPGVVGELLVLGVGVGDGYVTPHGPATDSGYITFEGEKAYRTGDRVRARTDGALEFLGRVDDQIKVRGRRIELQEVLSALASLPGARESSVALSPSDGSGEDVKLVGYLVATGAPVDPAPLMRLLRDRLPLAMVPSELRWVKELPRLSSGKVDVSKLPGLVSLPFEGAAPVSFATETERKVAEIVETLLGIERVGADDDFFLLGGHSLLAASLVSAVSQSFEKELPLGAVFRAPQVRALAAAIDQAPARTRLKLAEGVRSVRASFAQERLWVLEALHPGRYNLPLVLKLVGPLDPEALEGAISSALERHDGLRLTFADTEEGLHQRVGEPTPFLLERLVLDAQSVTAYLQSLLTLPFSLEKGPLVRGALIRLGENEHLLAISMHHALIDAPSMHLVMREVAVFYRKRLAFLGGVASSGTMGSSDATVSSEASELAPVTMHAPEAALLQRASLSQDKRAELVATWRTKLEGAPDSPIPVLLREGERQKLVRLHRTIEVRLSEIASRARVTPFVAAYAALLLTLTRLTGETDLVVGAPVALRPPGVPDSVPGNFLNSMVLRARLSEGATLGETWAKLREEAEFSLLHSALPFELLVDALQPERDVTKSPLFQLFFSFQDRPAEPLSLPGLEVLPSGIDAGEARFELSFALAMRGDGAIDLVLESMQGESASLGWLADAYTSSFGLLADAKNEDRWDALVQRKDALGEARAWESGPVHHEWTYNSIVSALTRTLPVSRKYLRAGSTSLAYPDLYRHAEQARDELVRLGVRPGQRVGVSLDRSHALVPTLLGIWLAGAAYVPVSPSDPRSRTMLMRAGCVLLVGLPIEGSEVRHVDSLLRTAAGGAAQIRTAAGGVAHSPEGTQSARPIPSVPATLATDEAYVLFTSGSTGEPKGVSISHGALSNILHSLNETVGLRENHRVFASTPLTFDIAGWEIWGALLADADLALRQADVADIDAQRLEIQSFRPTHLQATPTVWEAWLKGSGEGDRREGGRPGSEEDAALLKAFSGITKLVGGEALSADLAKQLLALGGATWNVYGPTETCIWSTAWQLDHETAKRGILPIGRPLANTTVRVVGVPGEPLGIGRSGEIEIAGAGVARGYASPTGIDEALTEARFVMRGEERFYRTGDRGHWRPDGTLAFEGRMDAQVKLRGHRLELEEIEARVLRLKGVTSVAAVLHPEGPTLYAAVTGAFTQASALDLREQLRGELPVALLPITVLLPELPLTPNGKRDRKRIAAMCHAERALVAGLASDQEATPIEREVAGYFAEVLNLPEVGVTHDFFALGGQSLLAMQLVSRLGRAMKRDVPLRLLFLAPTPRGMAHALGGAITEEPIPLVATGRVFGTLSPAQRRMWFLAKLDDGDASLHLTLAFRILGDLESGGELLRKAFKRLVARHALLRAKLVEGDEWAPADREPELEMLDGDDLETIGAFARRPFRFDEGPLARAAMFERSPNERSVVLVMHHLIGDAASLEIIKRDWIAFVADPSMAETSPPSYADVTEWQTRVAAPRLSALKQEWKARLDGAAPAEILPTRSDEIPCGREVVETVSLDVRSFARGLGVTTHAALLAAWQVLVARLSRSLDVSVGITVSGRDDPAMAETVGLFVNTVPVRTEFVWGESAASLVKKVHASLAFALSASALPFDEIVRAVDPERRFGHTPLFQTLFVHHAKQEAAGSLPDLKLVPINVPAVSAAFDFSLIALEEGDEIRLTLEFRGDRFGEWDAKNMLRLYREIVSRMSLENPWQIGSSEPKLESQGRQSLARSPDRVLFMDALQSKVQSAPTRIAIRAQDKACTTFAELWGEAKDAASLLLAQGVASGDRVLLRAEPGINVFARLLGVWWFGAIAVPVDARWPQNRILQVIERTEAWDPNWEASDRTEAPLAPSSPELPAYILFTSGSTGEPKGVVVTHGNLAAMIAGFLNLVPLTEKDSVLQFASMAFDTFFEETLPVLSVGGSFVIRPKEWTSIASLFESISEVTVLDLPTAFFHAWMDESPSQLPPSVHTIVLGGEAVTIDRIRTFVKAEWSSRVKLVNTYGPTECTVSVTGQVLQPERALPRVPIGRPYPGVQVHVVDAHDMEVPLGMWGELIVTGDQVAAGYWGDPAHPAFETHGERRYRTGDWVRWNEEGELEFLGRRDRQIKVRGMRVDLAEIELALRKVATDAAVVVIDGALLGAVVAPRMTMEEISKTLQRELPEHMVPRTSVEIAALPMNTSGKLDQAALLALVEAALPKDSHSPTPLTETEIKIAEVWQELLGGDTPRPEANFFQLGGDSLTAIRLLSRLRAKFGVEPPLRALFEHATLRGFARAVETSLQTGSETRIVRVGNKNPPLSFAQKRLWVTSRLDGPSSIYNLHAAIEIVGEVDASLLKASIQRLYSRHEALHATFQERDGEPVQTLLSKDVSVVELVDEALLQEGTCQARAEALVATAFDLEKGPLFRAEVMILGTKRLWVVWVFHHIVADGWSVTRMLEEVVADYRALASRAGDQTNPVPEPEIQYGDYAAHEASLASTWSSKLAYWEETLRDVSDAGPLPRMHSQTTHDRPLAEAGHLATRIEAPLANELRALASATGSTMFHVLLALLDVSVGTIGHVRDLVIAASTAGRTLPQIETLIGFFVNLLPIRARIDGAASFKELLAQIREASLRAMENEVPFERLVEHLRPVRKADEVPFVHVNFVYQNVPPVRALPTEWEIHSIPLAAPLARFDLILSVEDQGGALDLLWTYRPARVTTENVNHLANALSEHARWIVDAPSVPLESLARAQPVPIAPDLPHVIAILGACAARFADKPALSFGPTSLSYRALDERSHLVADRLRRNGIRSGQRVAIMAERSLETFVAILAVLKLGASYVPVDPKTPPARIETMLATAGVLVAIADDDSTELLPASLAWVLPLESLAEEAPLPTTPLPVPDPDGEAYVIFTSGSSGQPKGVSVPLRAIGHLAREQSRLLDLTDQDRVLQFASLGFDASVSEMWMAWVSGAVLDLGEPGRGWDGIAETLSSRGITVVTLPPALLDTLDPDAFPSLRCVLSAGDVLHEKAARAWAKAVRLFNAYGPTEATVCATMGEVRETLDGKPISIGKPLGEVSISICDPWGRPVPDGVEGEIVIGGFSVASGYLRAQGETAQGKTKSGGFSENPFLGRVYASGDRGAKRSDGSVLFFGRRDDQAKLRGFRLTLGEVEFHLHACPGVLQAACAISKEEAPRLVAFVVLGDGSALTEESLREMLRGRLAHYMVPARILVCTSLPLTRSGKIDRDALPWEKLGSNEVSHVAPTTPREKALGAIWSDVLRADAPGLDDDFFERGGDSILVLQLVGRAQRAGISIVARDVFAHPTLRALAHRAGEVQPAREQHLATGSSIEEVLTPLQEGMVFHSLYTPEVPVYVSQLSFELGELLDPGALRSALGILFERHEALRIAFQWTDDGGSSSAPRTLSQRIVPEVVVPLEVIDGSSWPDEKRRALREKERAKGFDLFRAPLHRIALVQRGDGSDLIWTHHHASVDGWSVGILLSELLQILSKQELPPAPSYRAYLRWLAAQSIDDARAYFENALLDAELPTALGIGGARRQTAEHVEEVREEIPGPEWKEWKAALRARGLTPASLVTAAWARVLTLYTQEARPTFGWTVAGRPASLEGSDRAVGLFINTLPVRLSASRGSAREWIMDSQKTLADVQVFAHTPLSKIASWLGKTDGLFESILVVENFPEATGSGVGVRRIEGAEQTNYALTAVAAPGEGLELRLAFDTDRFSAEEIRGMLHRWRTILTDLVEGLDAPLGPWMKAEEREHVRALGQGETRPVPTGTFVDRVREVATLTPTRRAVSGVYCEWNYIQLMQYAERVASQLQGAGSRIAIFAERSAPVLGGILGIAQSRRAFVPFDPAHPLPRLKRMAEDAKISAVLVTPQTALAAESFEVPRLELGPEGVRWLDDLPGGDSSRGDLSGDDPSGKQASADDTGELAYLLFTSGSTGRPKAVCVDHPGLSNYLAWSSEMYGLREGEVPVHTSLAFDLTLTALLAPLTVGGSVMMLPEGEGTLPLTNALINRPDGFAAIKLTPSHLALLLAETSQGRIAQSLIVGGEMLSRELVDRVYARDPRCVVFNEYGPTETVVGCSVERVSPGTKSVSIGRPAPNCNLRVLDPHGDLVPTGVFGELAIEGVQVALGYDAGIRFWNGHERQYRTGDRARLLPDGTFELSGRFDSQVKVRGVRIETSEVEHALREASGHPSLVLLRASPHAELVAFVETSLDASHEWSKRLRNELPSAFVPHRILAVPRFPLTVQGKVDHAALLRLIDSAPESVSAEAEWTSKERILIGALKGLLARAPRTRDDDFFALGGDSILTLALMGRLHKVGASITPRAVFSGRTIRRIAEAMTEVVVLQERRPTGPLPLSPIQHWFFDAPRKSYAHYNQSVLITLPPGTDATRLRQAFVETAEHHALGSLRFYQKDGAWHQESMEQPVPPEWTEHLLEDGLADLEPHAQEVQRSLCLEEGRLLRGVVYRMPDRSPARLLLVAHHLMVDAVSWRTLLADLESVYRGNPLGPHARSYASFAHELPALAKAHAGERAYWLRAAQPNAPVSTDSLLPGPGTAKRTEIAWSGSAHATPQELVVAGLVGAWLRHSKSDTCVIDLEGHGRSFAAEIDLSNVVGWFTALCPVRFTVDRTDLSVGQSPSPSAVLHAVRETLSDVPHGGVGFGLLKHVLADSDLAKAPTPPIALNYLGTLDTMVAGEFRPAPEGRGDESDPNERSAHPLEINAYLLEGKLTVDWQGPAKWIESLEPHFVENLRVLQADAPSKIRGESLPALNERSALKPVQLAEGPLAPIVLFAPVGGDVGAYAHFASHFQGERAVWAFPLEGDLASLLESKDVLEAALADLTKDGPCIVGGWSMGALIAMHATSKRTSGLLLALDQTPREKAGEVDTASILAEVLAPWGDASSLRGLSLEEQLTRALALAEKHAHPLRFVERSVLKQRVQIARNNFATLAKIDAPKTQLRVLSIAAIADRPGRSAEQVRAEWEGYASHVHVECINANHLDLLSMGHAKSVAEVVRREIGRMLG